MPMIGRKAHIDRLRRLTSPKVVKEINAALYEGADQIRAEAHRLISAGSVSGKNHIPAAKGEPPNRDTGNLQAHLEVAQPEHLMAEVRSEAEYAADLEFGDHPYLRPARDKVAPKVQKDLQRRLNRLAKGK